MFNFSETTAIAIILFLAGGILAWGYQRSKPFGKLGLFAWLQSSVLLAPWLIFFTLFATGIYINLIGILILLIISAGIYIYLGRKLRGAGQDTLLRERAAQRLQNLELTKSEPEVNNASDSNNPEILPIPEQDLALIKGIFGIDTFFATETISYQDGAIFRGNLRADPDIAYQKMSEKLNTIPGGKYRLFLVDGTEGRPVVIVLPITNDP
ncbi:MAG: site-2 protease family protein, partial [Microcystaceae cyanobacterium]